MARKSRKAVSASPSGAQKEEKVWKAALYIRLSVELDSKRGDSLETQRQIMEAYLALCPDIEVVGIYTDNGVTGRTFEREAFQRMLADLDCGKVNCVAVKDLSRLGRSAIDTGFYVEKYFPLHHIRFISVNDQYDSEDDSNSGSHVIVPLKNMMNEAYAADISRKVCAQQHQAMLEGAFIGGRAPYGYMKDPNNCHKLIVNEDTAPVVRQIFQWIADGVPLNAVVKLLNESNIPTPGRYSASVGLISNKRLIGDGVWYGWNVIKILRDEVYTGDMVQGKTKTVGHKQIATAPDAWIIVRGTHPPLISHELFQQVQDIRAASAARTKAAWKVPYTKNILRGRIFCGYCGKNIHRQRDPNGRYVYHCISNDRMGKGFCSAKGYISEDDLFHTILTLIRREAEAVVGNSLLLKRHDAKLAAQKAGTDHEIASLCRETERNRVYQASLYQNYASGVLTQTEYIELKEGYQQKIRQAVERVRQLRERQNCLERQLNEYYTLAERLSAVNGDTTLTASLVEQTVERITVKGPTDVSVRFHFTDTFAELMEALGDE